MVYRNTSMIPACGRVLIAGVIAAVFCVGGGGKARAQILVMASPGQSAEAPKEFGFQVEVDETVQAAFADFQRQAERKAWEKAFQAISELPTDKRNGMLADDAGCLIAARERIWNAFVSLPPEGREAFRIFYEPRAQKRYDSRTEQASPVALRRLMQEIFDQYFLTSVGDNAADWLGDAAFEQREFDSAARYWGAVLTHHPTTDLPEVRLLVKRALALALAGRESEFQAVRRQVEQRHPAATITLGGGSVKAAEFLAGITPAAAAAVVETAGFLPDGAPPESVDPRWKVPFLSKQGLKQLSEAVTSNYWYQCGLGSYVPVTTADANRVYCNWFGLLFALDADSGKLLWRTEKFSQMFGRFSQLQQGSLNFSGFGVSAGNGVVLSIAVPVEQMNHWQAQNRLSAYDAATGELKWTSLKVSSLSNYSFIGAPLIVGDEALAISHGQNQTDMTLRSLSLEDGHEVWSVKLGMAQGRQNRNGNSVLPAPSLLLRGDTLFVLANSGALLACNLKTRVVESVLRFEKPSGLGNNSRFYYYQPEDDATKLHTQGALLERDGLLYLKESRGKSLYKYDPATRKIIWRRPVLDSAQLVAVDETSCYVLGRELECFDRKSSDLKWSILLPISGGGLSAVPTARGLLVFTSRGLFEVSRERGNLTRIYRGADLSIGGKSTIIGENVLCVSNRSITLYPLAPADDGPTAAR